MIRISNVNYINTLPYRYTFEKSDFIRQNAVVVGQNPAGCAADLLSGNADIGLVPVGALNQLSDFRIIDGYGICAEKQVDSVLIFSETPFEKLTHIYLDYQSKSSNGFVKILENDYWKQSFKFLESDKGYEKKISGTTGGLIIGDRALELKKIFRFCTDIASEWHKYTDLPSVFAVWVCNNKIDESFEREFLNILDISVKNKKEVAEKYANQYQNFDLHDYLENKIQYRIGDKEKLSLELYQKLLRRL